MSLSSSSDWSPSNETPAARDGIPNVPTTPRESQQRKEKTTTTTTGYAKLGNASGPAGRVHPNRIGTAVEPNLPPNIGRDGWGNCRDGGGDTTAGRDQA